LKKRDEKKEKRGGDEIEINSWAIMEVIMP